MIKALFFWYLIDIPQKIFNGWKNFLKFGFHYFSISFLAKTFFSPWHKYFWFYPKYFDIAKILEVWISNQISRGVGIVARTFFILGGLIFEFLILIFGIFLIFGWFILPFLLFFGLIYGFRILF